MHESSMISNDFADAINGVHVSSTFIFEQKFAIWDTKTVVLLFLRYRPKRTRIDLFGMHFPSFCPSAAAIGSDPWLAPDRPRSGPEICRQAGPSLDQIGIWRCRHTACSVPCSLPRPRLADAGTHTARLTFGVRRCWRSL